MIKIGISESIVKKEIRTGSTSRDTEYNLLKISVTFILLYFYSPCFSDGLFKCMKLDYIPDSSRISRDNGLFAGVILRQGVLVKNTGLTGCANICV